MPTNHFTVADIALAAAFRADMLVNSGGKPVLTDFIEPNVAAAMINLELAALWDVLVSTYEDYCIKHIKIDVKAAQEDYPLPEDFYKFRKIFPITNNKRGEALRKFNLEELGHADTLDALSLSPLDQTKYKVSGWRLWLYPVPANAGQLEMWYVPQFKPMTNLEDRVDFRFPFGWEDYVIDGMAARFLEKEESDSTPQRRTQAAALQRILAMAEDRDVGEPFQIIG
jgi:hypothetical protein